MEGNILPVIASLLTMTAAGINHRLEPACRWNCSQYVFRRLEMVSSQTKSPLARGSSEKEKPQLLKAACQRLVVPYRPSIFVSVPYFIFIGQVSITKRRQFHHLLLFR